MTACWKRRCICIYTYTQNIWHSREMLTLRYGNMLHGQWDWEICCVQLLCRFLTCLWQCSTTFAETPTALAAQTADSDIVNANHQPNNIHEHCQRYWQSHRKFRRNVAQRHDSHQIWNNSNKLSNLFNVGRFQLTRCSAAMFSNGMCNLVIQRIDYSTILSAPTSTLMTHAVGSRRWMCFSIDVDFKDKHILKNFKNRAVSIFCAGHHVWHVRKLAFTRMIAALMDSKYSVLPGTSLSKPTPMLARFCWSCGLPPAAGSPGCWSCGTSGGASWAAALAALFTCAGVRRLSGMAVNLKSKRSESLCQWGDDRRRSLSVPTCGTLSNDKLWIELRDLQRWQCDCVLRCQTFDVVPGLVPASPDRLSNTVVNNMSIFKTYVEKQQICCEQIVHGINFRTPNIDVQADWVPGGHTLSNNVSDNAATEHLSNRNVFQKHISEKLCSCSHLVHTSRDTQTCGMFYERREKHERTSIPELRTRILSNLKVQLNRLRKENICLKKLEDICRPEKRQVLFCFFWTYNENQFISFLLTGDSDIFQFSLEKRKARNNICNNSQ